MPARLQEQPPYIDLVTSIKAIDDVLATLEEHQAVIEKLVIYAMKLQMDSEERDVDRFIGAIPESVVRDVMEKCGVDERLVNMPKIMRAAKNYKKKISR